MAAFGGGKGLREVRGPGMAGNWDGMEVFLWDVLGLFFAGRLHFIEVL